MNLDQALVASATGAAAVALAFALGGRRPVLSRVAIGALGGLAAGALTWWLQNDASAAETGSAGRGLMNYPGSRELDEIGGAM